MHSSIYRVDLRIYVRPLPLPSLSIHQVIYPSTSPSISCLYVYSVHICTIELYHTLWFRKHDIEGPGQRMDHTGPAGDDVRGVGDRKLGAGRTSLRREPRLCAAPPGKSPIRGPERGRPPPAPGRPAPGVPRKRRPADSGGAHLPPEGSSLRWGQDPRERGLSRVQDLPEGESVTVEVELAE